VQYLEGERIISAGIDSRPRHQLISIIRKDASFDSEFTQLELTLLCAYLSSNSSSFQYLSHLTVGFFLSFWHKLN
jgi:hypothetical protein